MKCSSPQGNENMKPEVNYTKCDSDDQVFCHRQQVCLPKHVNCTDPVIFDYFSVSQFANSSGRFTSYTVLTFLLKHVCQFTVCNSLLIILTIRRTLSSSLHSQNTLGSKSDFFLHYQRFLLIMTRPRRPEDR